MFCFQPLYTGYLLAATVFCLCKLMAESNSQDFLLVADVANSEHIVQMIPDTSCSLTTSRARNEAAATKRPLPLCWVKGLLFYAWNKIKPPLEGIVGLSSIQSGSITTRLLSSPSQHPLFPTSACRSLLASTHPFL